MEGEVARGDRRLHGLWRCFCLKSRRKVTAGEAAMGELDEGRVISAEEGDGVVRVKIVLSRKELKQLVGSMGRRRSASALLPPELTLEELVQALRRRRAMRRAESANGRSGWTPALQSIPEEDY
ncbi:hypothetical protein Cni_G14690 [Canna indica]|uniref:Uncharacterized protein n=1 Tax=Canna indica TaxID=4628 RepID=A0AAQ3KDB3_9LILI|nr:hypothetical protein Cni_G14690 [Canna indica]